MGEIQMNRDRETIYSEYPPVPNNMIMELTNACNHKCVFCGNHNQNRRVSVMDSQLAFSLIDQAYDLGVREIGFYLGGEPFLSPILRDCIWHSYRKTDGEKKMDYIYITTNGALATPERVKELVEAGLSSIKFSVNGATRESYRSVHGRDDFEKVYNNIRDINKAITDGEYELGRYISFIKCKQNALDVDLMHQLFDKLVDHVYIWDVEPKNGGYNYDSSSFALPGQTNKGNMTWPCEMIFNRLHVTSQGYLDACCIDYDNTLVVTDLRKMSLKDAWTCDVMRGLRRRHLNKERCSDRCWSCISGTDYENIRPINSQL